MTSFISSTEPAGTPIRSFDHQVQSGDVLPHCADAQSQRAPTEVSDAERAMTAAFIRWHVTGCWAAAADYHKARQAWELALMNQPTGDAE
jgi:hypothetical protein